MNTPDVLALRLEEAALRLSEAKINFSTELLLPPRDSEADFAGREVRKYVVRQRLLPNNTMILTLAYRV